MNLKLTNLSQQFHGKLDAVNALNEFFPLMHDEFESSLKSKLYSNLDLQKPDCGLIDLIGIMGDKQLENMKKSNLEFGLTMEFSI